MCLYVYVYTFICLSTCNIQMNWHGTGKHYIYIFIDK